MKKLLVALVVVALAVPMVASATATKWPGYDAAKYKVNVPFSAAAELKGTTGDALVENGKLVVTYMGGKEIWTFDEKVLLQEEIDPKTGKVAMAYTATATGPVTGNKQTYHVNCKNKAANECDAGIDSRNYWVIEKTDNGLKYLVYGVPKDKKGDATLKAEKRHEFVFTKAN